MKMLDSPTTASVSSVNPNLPVGVAVADAVLAAKMDIQRCYCTAAVKARRSTECPPVVSPKHPDLHAVTEKWVALRVMPQAEKMLSRALFEVGAPYVLPVRTEQRRGGVTIVKPSLSRTVITTRDYIDFLHHPLLERFVCSRVDIADRAQERFVDEVMDACRVAEQFPSAEFFPMQVKGTPVRVKRGPLMNVAGIVLGWNGGNAQFLVQIHVLGQAAELTISGDDLEPV
jgi:transcription antitermination factor NusG